jgi:MORN repeat
MKHGRGYWQDVESNEYIGEWKFDEADGHGVLISQDVSLKFSVCFLKCIEGLKI